MTLDDLVRAFASPVLQYGRVHDAETARARIDALFGARDAASVERVLAWLVSAGLRQEWVYFEYYVSRGLLKAEARDRARARKFAFIMANRARVGARGVLALDTMRACALAEWSVTAGWLSRSRATAQVAPLVSSALGAHASWSEVSEQIVLGLEYAEGELDDELRARVLALGGPWPSEAPAASLAPGEEPPSLVLALRLAVDCPGCGYAVSFPGLVDHAACRVCATEIALAPDEWSYFFSDQVREVREGAEGFDPIVNDHGVRFFSRTMTRAVPAAACGCGAPLALSGPGTLVCVCGRGHRVRVADGRALAVDEAARLVVEALPKPPDSSATFACASCGHDQPLGADPSRVRVCSACHERTYVDDAAHARSFDPPRRPTFYLVVGA